MTLSDDRPGRVLVIGAGGSLGSSLTTALRASDRWTAVSADRSIDVSVASDVDDLLEAVRPDAIVNLAGMTGARCTAEPERAWAVNVGGARNVARSAERLGIARIVFPSTSGVYGDRYEGHSVRAGGAWRF